jgi:hypothetical protein
MYPLLISYGPQALPSGSVALGYPTPPATGIIVDDSSARFSQEPADCWNDISVAPGQAQNANMSYVKPRVGAPNCIGRWAFPQGTTPGQYAVYVRIPSIRATSEGALYAIHHAGQISRVVINQTVFPNGFYATDGWVYAGKYGFDGVSQEFVELGNGTHDNSAAVANLDRRNAVRFVPGEARQPNPGNIRATNTPPPSSLRRSQAPHQPQYADRDPTAPDAHRIPNTDRAAYARGREPDGDTPRQSPHAARAAGRTPTATQARQPTATPHTRLSVYFVNSCD